LMLMLLRVWKPPRWMWDPMIKHVKPMTEPQKMYPRTGQALRIAFLFTRVKDHLRLMDFSTIPGWTGYVFWKSGVAKAWRKRFVPRMPRPDPVQHRRVRRSSGRCSWPCGRWKTRVRRRGR
jgi:hypothetical protein